MEYNILDAENPEAASLLKFGRPVGGKKGSQVVKIMTERGLAVNSLLTRDEWVEVDTRILTAARPLLRMVNDFRANNMVHSLGSAGSLVSRYYTSSEITAATINMSGRGSNRDLPDVIGNDIPVPIIWKDFEIDWRALAASRRSGDGLDTTTMTEAIQVVAEGVENLILGLATVNAFNGKAVYGLLNHPNRNTGSATGDWGTIANVTTTVANMVSAAMADYHYGPYMVYASTNQYNEATLAYYTDGSGETPRDRVLRMPQIRDLVLAPYLTDGTILLVQMDSNVADWAEPRDMAGVQIREWTTNDGMANGFKVFVMGAPRVKARQDGKSGIVVFTGA